MLERLPVITKAVGVTLDSDNLHWAPCSAEAMKKLFATMTDSAVSLAPEWFAMETRANSVKGCRVAGLAIVFIASWL